MVEVWVTREVARLSQLLDTHIAECTKVRQDTRSEIKNLGAELALKMDEHSRIQDDRILLLIAEQNKLTLRVAVAVISLLFTVLGLLLRKQGFF